MKRLLLFTLIFISTEVILASNFGNPVNKESDNIIDRSVEIRYVINHPMDDNFILVDEKKYPVFDSRKDAINYVTNMSIKYDLTIVYVRSVQEKETEFTDIIE